MLSHVKSIASLMAGTPRQERVERANRLRPLVQEANDGGLSYKAIGQQAGLSAARIHQFARKGATPTDEALAALERWAKGRDEDGRPRLRIIPQAALAPPGVSTTDPDIAAAEAVIDVLSLEIVRQEMRAEVQAAAARAIATRTRHAGAREMLQRWADDVESANPRSE